MPSFGPLDARILIAGLAPGLQGANRTGRPFTGDYAGDLLFRTLIKFGFAKGNYEARPDDGLKLISARITNAVRCVPPENKPTTEERDACAPFFQNELQLILPYVQSFVALGNFGWQVLVKTLIGLGHQIPAGKFGHGVTLKYMHEGCEYLIIGSYHPSQQNTFTGKLTKPMLDSVLKKAAKFSGII